MSVRCASLDITYRQLDHWTRLGYLHPIQRVNNFGTGSGFARHWPECELAVAAAMGRLTRAGLTVEAAHRVARAGRECAVLSALSLEGIAS